MMGSWRNLNFSSISKSKIFVLVCVSFIAGIFIGSILNLERQYIYYGLAVSASFFGILYFGSYYKIALVTALVFFIFAGLYRIDITNVENQYASVFGQKQQLEGYIVEDVDIRTNKQMITVQPMGYDQRLLVTTTKFNDYFYGDWVVVEGKIKHPKNFSGFDYENYLKRFGVYALMSYPGKFLVLKNSRQNWFKEQLLKIKYAFSRRVNKFLEEPKSSLLLGILIGARKTLPNEVVENFNATGTSHIIAISGFNITIIISALAFLARIFGRRTSFWLSLFIIIGFVVLSGASASVIRAAIMGALLLVSFNIGRMYAITPALVFTAALMLLFNPRILFWDISFQLSFIATMGIIYLLPLLEKLTPKWQEGFGLKGIILATLSATFVTLPFILFYFGRLSLVALLANILILPFVPWAMLFGFLIVLPFVSPGFSLLAGWLLEYILKVTEYLASLPFAEMRVEISKWILILLLALVAVFYFFLRKWAKDKKET